jgi:hypothetical protein
MAISAENMWKLIPVPCFFRYHSHSHSQYVDGMKGEHTSSRAATRRLIFDEVHKVFNSVNLTSYSRSLGTVLLSKAEVNDGIP